jgi:hypothetical protein
LAFSDQETVRDFRVPERRHNSGLGGEEAQYLIRESGLFPLRTGEQPGERHGRIDDHHLAPAFRNPLPEGLTVDTLRFANGTHCFYGGYRIGSVAILAWDQVRDWLAAKSNGEPFAASDSA